MFDILSSLSSFYFFSSWFFLYFTSSALYDFVSIASHQHMFDILFSLPFFVCLFFFVFLQCVWPSWNPSTQFSLTSCPSPPSSSVVFLWSFLCTSHYPVFHFTFLPFYVFGVGLGWWWWLVTTSGPDQFVDDHHHGP